MTTTIIFLLVWIAATVLVFLFCRHGIDMLKHPEEWKDTGTSGERILYLSLAKKMAIPESLIFRNVYVPYGNGQTSEIDLLVVSKKGLFVFECKNYGGNIYGNAKYQRWVQYMGGKKSYFYNPLLQNKSHVKHLGDFLKIDVPIVSLVSTNSRGKWKIKNLTADDHVLGINCHFKDIYNNMPESDVMVKHFNKILSTIRPLSRPSTEIRQAHISQVEQTKKRK